MNTSARPETSPKPVSKNRGIRIFQGKSALQTDTARESNRLCLQCLEYNTLVNGIQPASRYHDFRGVTAVSYRSGKNIYFILFAMWYSRTRYSYHLTALGQYSHEYIQQKLQKFRSGHYSHLQIDLKPIHPRGLHNLSEKLRQGNIPSADVVVLQDTLLTA